MTNTAFDISVHKNILFQILKDIYSDTTIAPLLGFKGGTAALMFFDLSRFSVDLDFDLLDENKEDYVFERIGKTSRDIYDVWFFLEHRCPINKEIVEKRAGMIFSELMQKCIEQLEKMNNRNILNGLGEFLSDSQKDWARAKLRDETIFLLKARLESEK